MLPLVSATGAAMLLLAGTAGGHMIMNTPTPYNLDIGPLLQVNPIDGANFPFPCHNKYGFTERTVVEAGGATFVNFTGGAQHGGGSCQFSITYDEPVDGGDWNKSASFKTIYSIIGGCPAVFTDELHNLAPAGVDRNRRQDGKHCGNGSGVDCIRQFMVPVPKFLKNGPATFAWTWFNKVGNKEMYMNCAPINITGGTGDEAQIEDLPDIFVANYPNDPEVPNCVTGTNGDNVVVNFPNPGKYGLLLQDPVGPAVKPEGYCNQIRPANSLPIFESGSQAAESDGGYSNRTEDTTSTSTTTAPSIHPTTNIPLDPTTGVNTTSITAPFTKTPPTVPTTFKITTTISSSIDLSQPTLPVPNPVLTKTPPTVPTTFTITTTFSSSIDLSQPTPPTPNPESNPQPEIESDPVSQSDPNFPKPHTNAVACPTHGSILCLDGDGGKTFGVCNWGWAVPQGVAKGTECKNGKIVAKRGGGGDDAEEFGFRGWSGEHGKGTKGEGKKGEGKNVVERIGKPVLESEHGVLYVIREE